MKHVNTKELKELIDVKKLLECYELQQISDDGRGWITALCPYHDDKHPSFGIRKSDTKFNCWSCKASGDAIKLVMDFDKLEFKDAVSKLAGMFGYNTDNASCLDYLQSVWGRKSKSAEVVDSNKLEENIRIFELHKRVVQLSMMAFEGSDAENYLYSRGFTPEVAKEFELGYIPNTSKNTKSLYSVLKQDGFTDAEIDFAGYSNERFTNRLTFPIYNLNGNVVAMSGRSLNNQLLPKYTATPNSDYYKKGLVLYGLNKLRKDESIILVEGNLDYIRLRSLDFNVLAQLGSALTKEQRKLLSSVCHSIDLMYDPDDAGKKSAFINILPLIENGLFVGVTTLPAGEDPDTYFRTNGKDEGLRIIINEKLKVGGLQFYMSHSEQFGIDKITAMINCLMTISRVSNKNYKDILIKQLSEITGYNETILQSELRKVSYEKAS